MKKLLCLVLALTMVFAFTVFAEEPAEEPAAEPGVALNTEDGMIGICVPGADHGWTAAVAYYAQQKVDELGLSEDQYRILTSENVNDQANDIEELINMGCTSIVLLPHNDEVSVAAEKIIDAGINLINFDRKVAGEYTAYLAGDNVGMGTFGADYLGEALGGEGIVAVMSTPSVGSVSTERVGGFKDEIAAKYPNIEIVDITSDGFTQEAGLKMASDALVANQHLDAIFSIDDEPSLGILQAVIESGRDDVKYISGGGGAQTWYTKIAETEDMNLFTETYSPAMIGDAIALAKDIQTGKEFTKDTILDPITVDASNVADYLDENSPY